MMIYCNPARRNARVHVSSSSWHAPAEKYGASSQIRPGSTSVHGPTYFHGSPSSRTSCTLATTRLYLRLSAARVPHPCLPHRPLPWCHLTHSNLHSNSAHGLATVLGYSPPSCS